VASKNRLTVVERVYYQSDLDEPTERESCYERCNTSEEQPYSRSVRVSQVTQIDAGWLGGGKPCGMVSFSNEEGKRLQKIPTPAEERQLQKRVLRVFTSKNSLNPLLVPPGTSIRFYIQDVEEIFLQSADPDQTVLCRYTIYPGA